MSKNKKNKAQSPVSSSAKKKPAASSGFIQFLDSTNFHLITLGIIVLAVSIIRWRLAPMPLERDEGEYAYFGHLILNGVTPYQEAYNMKLPGIYYMYALIMAIFGETYQGIHTGALIMNAGTMILLYYSIKKFFNPMTGLVAAGFYGLMAMSYTLLGFAAHATHFAVFYVALSLFFFSKYEQDKKILYAALTGVMLGMAFLMKQQAVYFILFGGVVFLAFRVLEKPVDIRKVFMNTAVFSAGVFIPYILVLLIMVSTGTFDKFWFWTVQYASKYASGLPWAQGKDLLGMTFNPIWEENKWIWWLGIIGVPVVAFAKFTWKQKILAIGFAVFGCLATTPGFYFRQHYFIVALPAVALLAGITLDYAGKLITSQVKMKAIETALPLLVLLFLFNNTVSKSKGYYSTENPVALCKALYGTNPFTESLDIANYIRNNSKEDDKIAVLGSEPQIAFYANRRSATGHIYTYGLMEIHEYNVKMQEEMIAEIEKNKPQFLVFCNVPFSWLSKPESPMKIFDWYGKYSAANYSVVGLVDIPPQGPSTFYWNGDAQRNPVNQNAVWVFKRKSDTTAAR